MTAVDRAAVDRSGRLRRRLALAVLLLACAGGAAAEARAEHQSDKPAREAGKKKPRAHVRHGEAPVVAADEPGQEARPAGGGATGGSRLCLIDRAAVDQQAAVSVASNNRLAELRAAAQAEVDNQKKALDAQSRGIEEEIKRRPDDAALKQKRLALALQVQAVAEQAGLYSREYEATRQGINNQLRAATTPIVRGIAAGNGCGIVLSGEAVVEVGDATDITRSVVEKMNAQLQFKPFTLVDLKER